MIDDEITRIFWNIVVEDRRVITLLYDRARCDETVGKRAMTIINSDARNRMSFLCAFREFGSILRYRQQEAFDDSLAGAQILHGDAFIRQMGLILK